MESKGTHEVEDKRRFPEAQPFENALRPRELLSLEEY